MRSVVRTLVAGGLLLVSLAAGLPARAGIISIEAAPGRQYVNLEGRTEVYVANPGDASAEVKAVPVISQGNNTWAPTSDLTVRPRHFTVGAHLQQVATVTVQSLGDTPCTLYGIAFQTTVSDTGSVHIRGQVVAQLVMRKPGGTEQDCIAAIIEQEPPPAPATSGRPMNLSWVKYVALVLLILGAGWLLILAGKRKERHKNVKRARGHATGF